MGALAGALPAAPAASQEANPLRLGTTRTVHLTSALLRDALLGPLIGPSTFCLAMRLEDIPTAIRIGFANDIALDYRIAAVAACLERDWFKLTYILRVRGIGCTLLGGSVGV